MPRSVPFGAVLLLTIGSHAAKSQIAITKVTNSADLKNGSTLTFVLVPGPPFPGVPTPPLIPSPVATTLPTEIPMPGGLATVFCTGLSGRPGDKVVAEGLPLPLQLAGLSVDVFSSPAPILAVAFENTYQQINIQVPWEARA